MPAEEITGTRDLTPSRSHRPSHLAPYIGLEVAMKLPMIDLDGIEYCYVPGCSRPLALVEYTRSKGFKATTVTRKLAEMAGLPVYLIQWEGGVDGFVSNYWIQQVSPVKSNSVPYDVAAYAEWLVQVHTCPVCGPVRS